MGLFNKNKIVLTLEKDNYSPGELIKGNIKIDLKKPLKARNLEVGFFGMLIEKGPEREVHYGPHDDFGRISPNNTEQETHTQIVYTSTIQLDNEKEYFQEKYSFEFKIPSDIDKYNNYNPFEGKLGKFVSAVKKRSITEKELLWYVKTQLDVPLGIDLRNKQFIKIN